MDFLDKYEKAHAHFDVEIYKINIQQSRLSCDDLHKSYLEPLYSELDILNERENLMISSRLSPQESYEFIQGVKKHKQIIHTKIILIHKELKKRT